MRQTRVILLGVLLTLAFGSATGAVNRAVSDARAQLDAGDDNGALRAAKDILVEDPRNADALYVAGVASLNLDRLNDAERFLERASRAAPDAAEVEYQLGLTLATMANEFKTKGKTRIAEGLFEEALEHFESELERSPDHARAITARAETFLDSGEITEATEAFEDWIATNPDNAEGYVALVRLYTAGGRVDDARELLPRFPSKTSKAYAEATFLVARSLYLQDPPADAGALLESLKSLPAEPWQVPALQALDYLSRGQGHEAADSLLEFIDRDPPAEEIGPIAVAYHDLFQRLRQSATPDGPGSEDGGNTTPTLSMGLSPKYPTDAERYGVTGEVLLLAIIGPDGAVGRLTVLSTTASRHASLYRPQFEKAALTAVREWKYEPARRNGQPVAFPITLNLTFAP